MGVLPSRKAFGWPAVVLLGSLAVIGARSHTAPPQAFSIYPDWQVEIDGKPTPGVRIYRSVEPVTFLLVGEGLARPLLLWPRVNRVESSEADAIQAQPDGQLILSPQTVRTPAGEFAIVKGGVEFDLENRHFRVQPRPPLLRYQTAQQIQAYDKRFLERADAYEPDPIYVDAIRAFPRPATVTYLGTWWNANCKDLRSSSVTLGCRFIRATTPKYPPKFKASRAL